MKTSEETLDVKMRFYERIWVNIVAAIALTELKRIEKKIRK